MLQYMCFNFVYEMLGTVSIVTYYMGFNFVCEILGTGIHNPALQKPDCVGAFSLMGEDGWPLDEPLDVWE